MAEGGTIVTQAFTVPREKLRQELDPRSLPFDSTAELQPLDGIFGQKRAVQALAFGLSVKSPDYNIFVTGPTGTGRSTYTQKAVHQRAGHEAVPDDWCYVYNFEQPYEPIALRLPPGVGAALARDMEHLVEELQQRIPKVFESEDYQKSKERVIKQFQEKSNALIEKFRREASAAGFSLQRTPAGFMAFPTVEDRPLKPEEISRLDETSRQQLEANASAVENKMQELGRHLRALEKEAQEQVAQLDKGIGYYLVSLPLSDLKGRYREFPQVVEYLQAVQEDIVENLDDFRTANEQQNPLDFLFQRTKGEKITKYSVNLLVDNSKQRGAPVIIETNPTYYNLTGKIEYKGQLGLMMTDFSMIKAGALHRANGGYLVLFAEDILRQPAAWDALKKALKNQEVSIENMAESYGLIPTASIKPEPIRLKTKVILIGSPVIYNLLYHLDEDFSKLFKVKVDFSADMDRTPANIANYAAFIASHCRQAGLKHFSAPATAKLIDYSTRLAEDQGKLSASFNKMVEIICEADAWAQVDGAPQVEASHVVKALEEKEYRSNKLEERIRELIARGDILIDTRERVIGQVNGLSVIDLGDYQFGKPSRITARTYSGKEGVLNIERESRLSGRIHDKGVLILSGYLGGKYARNKPLALSATICFEQSYDGVEGDSASSAELYALLSSLAGVPLYQGIAVTGSVNQRGQIQPIGGVNRKIEGFFTVCKLQGFTGNQGVIIPRQNVKNLQLKDEVIEAAAAGKFHIYAIDNIEEGLEILTGLPAGEPDAAGNYPKGTFNYLVNKSLEEFAAQLRFHRPWSWLEEEQPAGIGTEGS
ncbi:MAG TPA: AAA family ATPase [Firmicutes bacterium]|nr:AAA family ATPase [Bacillota bacterium]